MNAMQTDSSRLKLVKEMKGQRKGKSKMFSNDE